ncbi:MAG: cytochrome C oxidase subunit IV family protein [Vicingus serpentipes]|nr:cytochrome C oxidase subunit IV family protein [Vicingus serpentipes]
MEHSDNKPYKYAVHHSEEEGKKIRKRIWLMFWVLLAITTIEVLLGIFWKEIGVSWGAVKMTFIVMTVIKAFFIVSEYMHLKHENSALKNTIIIPYVMFALYLLYHILTEGVYSEMLEKWLW